jgi:hypothetical protein
VEEQVVRLEVAVHHARLPRDLERARHLVEQHDQLVGRQAGRAAQPRREIDAHQPLRWFRSFTAAIRPSALVAS